MKWRKWISSLVVLALIVTLCPVSASSAGNTVNIPDPAFLAYLNSELDETRPSDTLITQEEMASLTSIDTHRSDEEIRSIAGISAAVNLKKLTISGDITGLEEIATLKNLTSLSVTDNKYVENLSFLGEKPDLISLTVGFAPNMTTLQGLTSQNCPSLATLNLSDNTRLVDISALANVAFPHLTKLDLGDSPAIPSISALRGYISLTNLNLEKVEITPRSMPNPRSTTAHWRIFLDVNVIPGAKLFLSFQNTVVTIPATMAMTAPPITGNIFPRNQDGTAMTRQSSSPFTFFCIALIFLSPFRLFYNR